MKRTTDRSEKKKKKKKIQFLKIGKRHLRHFTDCYKHLQKCLKSNHQPSRKCTVLTVLTGMAEQRTQEETLTVKQVIKVMKI